MIPATKYEKGNGAAAAFVCARNMGIMIVDCLLLFEFCQFNV